MLETEIPEAINHPSEGGSNGNGGYLFWILFIKLVVEGTGIAWADRIRGVVDHSALLLAENDAESAKDKAVNKMEEPAVNGQSVRLVDVDLDLLGNNVTVVVDGAVVVV
jgi:hypothetical protein